MTSIAEARRRGSHAGEDRRSSPGARALVWLDGRHVVIYLVVVAVSLVLYALNLSRAPDFDIDEVLYTYAGQQIGSHGSITFGGGPILVHPPLYFLTLGAWLSVVGDLHTSILTALHAARYLNIFFCIGDTLLTMSLVKAFTKRTGSFRSVVLLATGLLAAFDPFLLRFGRSVLLEPMAVFLGLMAIRVAWGLRDSPSRTYVPIYGALVGISVLCKEPAIFISAAPLVAALLKWDRRAVVRNLAAMLVGALVFSSFAWWAIVQGQGHAFWHQSTYNVDRLLGLAQVTGLNRPKASPLASFTDTFLQYSCGYVLLLTGGVSLAAALRRLRGRIREDDVACILCGFGILSFVFLVYSIFVGQGNEQLTVYAVPASVLLTFLGWELYPGGAIYFPRRGRVDRERRHRWVVAARGVGSTIALAAGALSWVAYIAHTNDSATSRVEHYLSTSLPACTLVNSTGEPFRWSATLTNFRFVGFGSGPQALAAGVRVFLVSPKDDEFYYGASSPALTTWIRTNGHEVFSAPSHTYGSIQVWEVGNGISAPTSSACTYAFPPVARDAKVEVFLTLFCGAVAFVGAGGLIARSERKKRAVAA